MTAIRQREEHPNPQPQHARFPLLQGAQMTLATQTEIDEDEVLRCE